MFHSTFFPVGSFQLVKADQRFKEICNFHLKLSTKDSVSSETYFYKLYVSGHNFLRDKLSVGISVKTLRKVILFPKKCLRDICLRELILFANKCLRDLCLREFILFAYKSLRDLCLKEVLLFGKICLRVFCLRNFCLRDLYLKVLLLFSRCVSGTSVSGISASGTAFSGTSVPGNSFSLPTDISGNTC